jgi:hypothetical protein
VETQVSELDNSLVKLISSVNEIFPEEVNPNVKLNSFVEKKPLPVCENSPVNARHPVAKTSSDTEKSTVDVNKAFDIDILLVKENTPSELLMTLVEPSLSDWPASKFTVEPKGPVPMCSNESIHSKLTDNFSVTLNPPLSLFHTDSEYPLVFVNSTVDSIRALPLLSTDPENTTDPLIPLETLGITVQLNTAPFSPTVPEIPSDPLTLLETLGITVQLNRALSLLPTDPENPYDPLKSYEALAIPVDSNLSEAEIVTDTLNSTLGQARSHL